MAKTKRGKSKSHGKARKPGTRTGAKANPVAPTKLQAIYTALAAGKHSVPKSQRIPVRDYIETLDAIAARINAGEFDAGGKAAARAVLRPVTDIWKYAGFIDVDSLREDSTGLEESAVTEAIIRCDDAMDALEARLDAQLKPAVFKWNNNGASKTMKKNPKHPTATYPRAKLKLPKGVDPQRKRAAPKGQRNGLKEGRDDPADAAGKAELKAALQSAKLGQFWREGWDRADGVWSLRSVINELEYSRTDLLERAAKIASAVASGKLGPDEPGAKMPSQAKRFLTFMERRFGPATMKNPRAKAKKNTSDGPLFDAVRASAAASLAAEAYERKAAKARAKAKAEKAGKKNAGSPDFERTVARHQELAIEWGKLHQKAQAAFAAGASKAELVKIAEQAGVLPGMARRANRAGVVELVRQQYASIRGHLAILDYDNSRGTHEKLRAEGLENPKGKVKRPKPVSELTEKDFAPITKLFKQYVALFAKRYARVALTSLKVDSTIHKTERAFAMTHIPAGAMYPDVHIAPELAFEPATVQRGIITHELSHASFLLGYGKAPADYDANERATDRRAEEVTGLKIYYDKRGVEVAGKGAKGVRPRPDGLR